ncbi:hypothetical protein Nepgr_003736 [Nepenthes gracilis]|uniref:Uncharacterized protein n=1 Tax=Nepenthes gracilis TaxID=150966 RepID=A0AAD3S053_NEPGR|nr:hypothetical protein Nepgr_003736 [Nepenthes gracilis]
MELERRLLHGSWTKIGNRETSGGTRRPPTVSAFLTHKNRSAKEHGGFGMWVSRFLFVRTPENREFLRVLAL